MAKRTKRERLEDRRPPCPKCQMRMMAIKPQGNRFECLRCGYTGAPTIAR